VEVYPALYALEPNSSELTDAMDVARGGQFITIPNPYPEEAWYHYDDWTCEYDCMAMEYLYWCIVTNMGILADTQTCQGIADEWEPCTPELFESTDTLMYNLVTNPDNKLPQFAPDGNYCPEQVGINKDINPGPFPLLSIFPNPFNPTTTIEFSIPQTEFVTVKVYNIVGHKITTLINDELSTGNHSIQWDVSRQPSGLYFIQIESGSFIQTKKMVLLK
jgi:hypothetical protein